MYKDLTGKRFGRLKVIKYSYSYNYSRYWECICDCGNKTNVSTRILNSKGKQSCGCLHKDFLIKLNKSRNNKNENNGNWKGGYRKNNIPTFSLYSPKISYAEKTRQSFKDKNILEVKCTYCGKWYTPTIQQILSRVSSLEGRSGGEYRLYCSDECKQECPIFGKILYSAEENNTKEYSREVQPELRQLIFERDNYTCQKCGSDKSLHCHHIEGIRWDALESADIDRCITLCKNCHKKVHKIEGCTYNDMKCIKNNK